jgi:hypothetical protein
MIMDAQNLFSDAQAVTTTAGSTNYIDLGPLATGQDGRDVGVGDKALRLVIITDTAVQSTASSTVTFSLEKDIYTDFTTAVAVWTSAAVAKATLVAGYKVADIALPKMDTAKYLRVKYTVATADLTTGAFTAFLTLDSQDKQAYAAGYSFATGA